MTATFDGGQRSGAVPLALGAYRAWVRLDERFAPPERLDEAPEGLLLRLVRALSADAGSLPRDLTPRQQLTALLTVRPPQPYLDPELLRALDAFLHHEGSARPRVSVASLPTIAQTVSPTAFPAADVGVLWQGDITTLACDAIVNAANDAMRGCFHPFHACIDHAIHAAAGPRLREDGDRIMSGQGGAEPTGLAKVTRGYHLPARFVLHTVGPLHPDPGAEPGPALRAALAASYRACLDLATEVGTIRTVAFCCISTGVFGFPARPAAAIALSTVADWLAEHPGQLERVVFNVFSPADRAVYAHWLAHWPPARP